MALDDSRGTFDLLNTGAPVRSGWIDTGDGFLALDSNANGRIDNLTELFGGKVGEGYAKLQTFDSNKDGQVDARDEESRVSSNIPTFRLNSLHGQTA